MSPLINKIIMLWRTWMLFGLSRRNISHTSGLLSMYHSRLLWEEPSESGVRARREMGWSTSVRFTSRTYTKWEGCPCLPGYVDNYSNYILASVKWTGWTPISCFNCSKFMQIQRVSSGKYNVSWVYRKAPRETSYENFCQSASRLGTTCSILLRRVSPLWKEVITSSHPVPSKFYIPSLRTSLIKWYSGSRIRSLAQQKGAR